MFKNYLNITLLFSALFTIIFGLSSCKLGRFVVYNFANITDHKKFPSRELKAPEVPFQFAVAEKGIAPKTITGYLQERVWSQIGMEYDASWSIDCKNDGIEKTYCCLNARARDFAKLGRLYLNDGKWDGEQIIPEKSTMALIGVTFFKKLRSFINPIFLV